MLVSVWKKLKSQKMEKEREMPCEDRGRSNNWLDI